MADTSHIVITMPVYEDWESAALLCAAIDKCLLECPAIKAEILFIDDGSGGIFPAEFPAYSPRALRSMRLLSLRRNLGHQRAIAVALAYIQQNLAGEAVIVMDADGEDRPEDICRLVAASVSTNHRVTVFAERGRRVEGLSFRVFYSCYRLLHRILTGRSIRFGNFSLLPRHHVDSLVTYPELWNHYAAAVLKARLPFVTIRADRATRLRGRSRMNFVSLTIHGLSALFAGYEVVGTRLLVGTALLGLVFGILILVVVGVKVLTQLAIPGWATFTVGLLFVLVTQLIATSLAIIFSVMISRNNLGFLPTRDYGYFVARCTELPLS